MNDLAAYASAARERLGQRSRRRLGIVDGLTIRRYAVAIGDMNPLYHDEAAARAAGYADVLAPPNLLAAIVDWGAGRPESELGPDGTTRHGGDFKVMGAGEEMELLAPVTAGAEIFEESFVDAVEEKAGRSGPLVFVTTVHEFLDGDGRPYSRNRRTVMVRA